MLVIATVVSVLAASWNYSTLVQTRAQLASMTEAKAAAETALATATASKAAVEKAFSEAQARLSAVEKAMGDVKAALTVPAAPAAEKSEPAARARRSNGRTCGSARSGHG